MAPNMSIDEAIRKMTADLPPISDEQAEAAAHILVAAERERAKKRLLSYPDAATYLGISLSYMKQLAKKGEIPKTEVGSRVLFDRVELDEFVERLKRAR
jgi:excisionase family DNA binding protein